MLISDGINHGKLQSIIVGELKKAGLKHRLKKYIMKNVKDHKTVFRHPRKVPSTSVICCGSNLSVPIVVKPLISAEVQDLLLRCRITAGDALKPILHTLLLLPVLHVHLLHYIMELLNYIASRHKDNLMDASNLAIVMAPSIMPLPAAASAQRLEHHVALVKIFIENSKRIGLLTEDLMSQLDDDSDVYLARRKKRRSGSLNRMLSGLRKMVSGNVNTPATVREHAHAHAHTHAHATPVLCKSASKRKFDSYDGLSAKVKKEITDSLPQKDLSFTPMKVGLERKRLRLSLMDARSTPVINTDFRDKNSETSISSEDLLTSSENLFSNHHTIDLSPDTKPDKDYVRISKTEYEEIKSRVSAIENRLSREFTDVIPRVQPLQQVQNKYEQTLEEVAMLNNCPNSDNLARRLSKELKIRPDEQAKIIRSPSARKIGTIRRRSKENVTKIVRHKSWNVSTQSQASQHADRFYPYVGVSRRERTSSAKPQLVVTKMQNPEWDSSKSDNSTNVSDNSIKYHLRRRVSLAPDYNLDKTIGKREPRRSLNEYVEESAVPRAAEVAQRRRLLHGEDREVDASSGSGRPSVNKLRRQNAGAVLAKAKLFETSSDRSSELQTNPLTAASRAARESTLRCKRERIKRGSSSTESPGGGAAAPGAT
ncbi:rhoGAP domain-containing protein [Phthorimaea operculella]|nr:rhoGAP domain-containing protein [Phthorimaea operculella]